MGVLEFTYWINLEEFAVLMGPLFAWVAVGLWCYIMYRLWIGRFDR